MKSFITASRAIVSTGVVLLGGAGALASADGIVLPDSKISFDLEKAVLAGTGCDARSSLSLLGSGRLLLDLPDLAISVAEWEQGFSERKSCVLALPYEVDAGLQIVSLRLSTEIYLFKSPDSAGAFALNASAGGRPDSASLSFQPGRLEVIRKRSWKANLDLEGSVCGGQGILRLTAALSGLKQEAWDYSKLGLADESQIRAEVVLAPCSPDQRKR